MSGSRNNSVGRLAALAAADRVKLLLAVVEDDEFLSEVLHSANRTIGNMTDGQAAGDLAAGSDQGPARRRPAFLGPGYHAAKKRALRLRRAATTGRRRPLGRV